MANYLINALFSRNTSDEIAEMSANPSSPFFATTFEVYNSILVPLTVSPSQDNMASQIVDSVRNALARKDDEYQTRFLKTLDTELHLLFFLLTWFDDLSKPDSPKTTDQVVQQAANDTCSYEQQHKEENASSSSSSSKQSENQKECSLALEELCSDLKPFASVCFGSMRNGHKFQIWKHSNDLDKLPTTADVVGEVKEILSKIASNQSAIFDKLVEPILLNRTARAALDDTFAMLESNPDSSQETALKTIKKERLHLLVEDIGHRINFATFCAVLVDRLSNCLLNFRQHTQKSELVDELIWEFANGVFGILTIVNEICGNFVQYFHQKRIFFLPDCLLEHARVKQGWKILFGLPHRKVQTVLDDVPLAVFCGDQQHSVQRGRGVLTDHVYDFCTAQLKGPCYDLSVERICVLQIEKNLCIVSFYGSKKGRRQIFAPAGLSVQVQKGSYSLQVLCPHGRDQVLHGKKGLGNLNRHTRRCIQYFFFINGLFRQTTTTIHAVENFFRVICILYKNVKNTLQYGRHSKK